MCGICGWIDKEPINVEILKSMCNTLSHRGPDAQQVKVIGKAGLGHTRLSIIDLSDSAGQPMQNEDGTKWLVYNGEFYTFKHLREKLISKGHYFTSKSDSEVLIHQYEEDGPEFIKKLRGIFAFGLWDTEKQQLMIARDQVGIKPLYYYHKDNTLLFASELKALLRHPSVNKEFDNEAINYYFMLGYIPRELCIFKGVKKLLPGHYLLYKNGCISIRCYWSLPDNEPDVKKSEQEYLEDLLNLLDESVRNQLISDVPIGAFLSGGLDSSIVAALMAKNSSVSIKTFSIGFEELGYNELPYARQVAKHIGSDHYEMIVRADHIEALEKLAYYYDEPFADSSVIPTYFVSKMARDQVKVVLSGDGGDELFGGYNWYTWVLLQQRFKFLPYFIRKGISKIAKINLLKFRGQHFLGVLNLDEFDTFLERTGFFTNEELPQLMPDICTQQSNDQYKKFYLSQGGDTLSRLTRTDFHYYLPDDILTKVDRASMSVGLEARVPLLDHKICEFAFRLPTSLKIKNNKKKYLLKKVAEELLPANFPLERKQGFSIPLDEWMKKDLGDMCMDLVRENKNGNVFFQSYFIEKLYQDNKKGKCNNAQKLWSILSFYLWQSKVFTPS